MTIFLDDKTGSATGISARSRARGGAVGGARKRGAAARGTASRRRPTTTATRGPARRRGRAWPTSSSSSISADAVTKVILPELKKRGSRSCCSSGRAIRTPPSTTRGTAWATSPSASTDRRRRARSTTPTTRLRQILAALESDPALAATTDLVRHLGPRLLDGRAGATSTPRGTPSQSAVDKAAGARRSRRVTCRRASWRSMSRPHLGMQLCDPDESWIGVDGGDGVTRRSAPTSTPRSGTASSASDCLMRGAEASQGGRRRQRRIRSDLRSGRRRRDDRRRGDVSSRAGLRRRRVRRPPGRRRAGRAHAARHQPQGERAHADAFDRRRAQDVQPRSRRTRSARRSTSRTRRCSRGRGGTAASGAPTSPTR